MLDQAYNAPKKNRVNLSDYDYESDITNRLILSRLDEDDVEVLEEILFNSVHFPIHDICDNLDMDLDQVRICLDHLAETGLFLLEDETVHVNKEIRKAYESLLQRFESDFNPGIDFVQSLLKRVPIHILPMWYPIPKSSNNIFDSLIERYFHTPQLFERYLSELDLEDEIIGHIIKDVLDSPDLKLPAETIRNKYKLDHETFEKYMLILEYNFVTFSKYEKVDGKYVQMVMPFHEWREYALFVRSTTPAPIEGEDSVEPYREDEFAFSSDMATVLETCFESPLAVTKGKTWLISDDELRDLAQHMDGFDLSDETEYQMVKSYLSNVIQKLIDVKLATVEDGHIKAGPEASEWLSLNAEKRAFSVFKHPNNQLHNPDFPAQLHTERNIREIEKSIADIADKGWIYFEDFMKGLIIPLNEESRIELKKDGRAWKYNLPSYTPEEKQFIEMTILEWLFESGIIRTGILDDKICFCATSLGQSLFAR